MTVLTDRPGTVPSPVPSSVPSSALSATSSPDLHDTVKAFLREATHGPEKSGLSGTLSNDGVVIEMSASRGWGVQFTRTMTDGRVERRHLAGDDLTIERAAAVCFELSRGA